MDKSFVIPAHFNRVRVGGQVPSREGMEAMRLVSKPAPEFDVARLLDHTNPMLTVDSITRDLGFDLGKSNEWNQFLKQAMTASNNEIVFRQAVMAKCLESKFDSGLRRALLQRSLQHWRGLHKAGDVQVLTPDQLLEKGWKGKRGGDIDHIGPDGKPVYKESKPKKTKKKKLDAAAMEAAALEVLAKDPQQLWEPDKLAKELGTGKKKTKDLLIQMALDEKIFGESIEIEVSASEKQAKYGFHSAKSIWVFAGEGKYSDKKLGMGWSGKKRLKTAQKKQDAKLPKKVKKSLEKGEAVGGMYHRRVARKSGKGFTYYYKPEDYNKRKDAHVNGEDAERTHISGKVMKCVEGVGKGGCGVDGFKDLVKKYGSKKVAASLTEHTNGGKLSFKKGKFYTKAKPKLVIKDGKRDSDEDSEEKE